MPPPIITIDHEAAGQDPIISITIQVVGEKDIKDPKYLSE
jgi:hypothetical protein